MDEASVFESTGMHLMSSYVYLYSLITIQDTDTADLDTPDLEDMVNTTCHSYEEGTLTATLCHPGNWTLPSGRLTDIIINFLVIHLCILFRGLVLLHVFTDHVDPVI